MRNSKIFLVAFGTLCGGMLLFVSLQDLAAQTRRETSAPGVRVAVCDIAEVLDNYKRAKDTLAKMDTQREAIQREDEKRGKAIQSLRMELEGLKEGSPKYRQTAREIRRLEFDRQAWRQLRESDIANDQYLFTKEMYDEILKMIETVARAKGIDLVLFRQGKMPTGNMDLLLRAIRSRRVLYSTDTIDITEQTLRLLNDRYTKAAH